TSIATRAPSKASSTSLRGRRSPKNGNAHLRNEGVIGLARIKILSRSTLACETWRFDKHQAFGASVPFSVVHFASRFARGSSYSHRDASRRGSVRHGCTPWRPFFRQPC